VIALCGWSPKPRNRAYDDALAGGHAGVNEALSLIVAPFNCDVVRHSDAESLVEAEPPDANDIVFVDLHLPGASKVV
jgi:FixJ family two-component response regulator